MCNYYRGSTSAHPGSNPRYPAPKSGIGVKSPYKKIKQVICEDRRAPVVVVNTSLDRLASHGPALQENQNFLSTKLTFEGLKKTDERNIFSGTSR
jgi:hypothetical protein